MDTIKTLYTKYLKRWVKAIASAVGGAIAGLIINWVQGTTPIPQTRQELLNVVVAALLPALLALLSPANKITQKQLDDDPNVIGGTVIDTPPPAATTYPTLPVSTNKPLSGDYSNPFPDPKL